MKKHLIGVYNGQEVYERSDIPDNHIHCGIALLKDALGMAGIENVPFRRYNVEFDTAVGTDRCVHVNENDTVVMWQRPTRAGKTPMVISPKEAEPTNNVFIVMCKDTDNDGRLTIATAYTGNPGTKEPWDNFDSEAEQKAAAEYWSCRALIPTAEELAQMISDGVITAEEAKQEMERRA